MNKTLRLIIVTVLVMVVLPWMIVIGAKAEAMGLVFLLFYAGYPLYSVFIGWRSGKDIKKRWFLPILSAGVFLLGTLLIFTPEEMMFYKFALVYLVIGILVMFIYGEKGRKDPGDESVAGIKKNKDWEREEEQNG